MHVRVYVFMRAGCLCLSCHCARMCCACLPESLVHCLCTLACSCLCLCACASACGVLCCAFARTGACACVGAWALLRSHLVCCGCRCVGLCVRDFGRWRAERPARLPLAGVGSQLSPSPGRELPSVGRLGTVMLHVVRGSPAPGGECDTTGAYGFDLDMFLNSPTVCDAPSPPAHCAHSVADHSGYAPGDRAMCASCRAVGLTVDQGWGQVAGLHCSACFVLWDVSAQAVFSCFRHRAARHILAGLGGGGSLLICVRRPAGRARSSYCRGISRVGSC